MKGSVFNGSGGGARLQGIQTPPKTVMEATRIPQRRRGESSDPIIMQASNGNTSVDDRRSLS